MSSRLATFFPALSTLSLALLFAAPAAAHISLEQGGTHLSRYGDSELKDGPCGRKGGTRGTNIYTYAPGQTITVSAVEFVGHPSYFRFAFDNDGDDAFIEPASIQPIDPTRKCPDGAGDHCGKADYYNSSAVLPGMDDLNPHLAPRGTPKYTWQVTLPNIECTNCTLQLIQVMEDDLLHGPYDPTPGVGTEDIYHQCIDIVLKAGAVASGPDASAPSSSGGSDSGSGGTSSGGPPTGGDASTSGGSSGGSSGGGSGGGSGGASTGNGGDTAANSDGSGSSGGCAASGRGAASASAGAWALVALSLFVSRRRRARRAPGSQR